MSKRTGSREGSMGLMIDQIRSLHQARRRRVALQEVIIRFVGSDPRLKRSTEALVFSGERLSPAISSTSRLKRVFWFSAAHNLLVLHWWVALLRWEQWMTSCSLLTYPSCFLSILLVCGATCTPYHSRTSCDISIMMFLLGGLRISNTTEVFLLFLFPILSHLIIRFVIQPLSVIGWFLIREALP